MLFGENRATPNAGSRKGDEAMLDLQQLQYFRTVARLQHITKAANELHISQPNLSNAIKRLETSLGGAAL